MSRFLQYADMLRWSTVGRTTKRRTSAALTLFTVFAAAIASLSVPASAATSEVPFVGAIHYTYIDKPVTQNQNAFSTTLQTVSGDQVVSRATFSVPFTDPQVQQAVAGAKAILAADGSESVNGPVLLSSVTSQDRTFSYEITGHGATATQSLGVPIATLGPKTIEVDLNYMSALTDFNYEISPQPIFVPLGQEFYSRPTTFNWTVNRNAVTTNTVLLSQTYAVTGTGSDASQGPVLSVALPSAAWSGLVTLSCIALIALVRNKFAAGYR